MSCYHPLIGIWKGEFTESGKKKYEIISLEGKMEPKDSPGLEHTLIPCGQCIGCRLDYSRRWADRMMLELETTDEKRAIFLTLTYDEEHLPIIVYDENGKPEVCTLKKRDFQLFMKNFRKKVAERFGRRIRFYCSGEYGEKNGRSHYHCIVFGICLDDFNDEEKSIIGRNEFKQPIYDVDWIHNIWDNGYIAVAECSYETCAYVARYVTKKVTGKAAEDHYKFGQEREWSLMSRKPGIGRRYLDEHPDCLDEQTIVIQDSNGAKRISVPKYFLMQLKKEDEMMYNEIVKKRKKLAEDKMMLELSKTDLGFCEYLEKKEEFHKERLKKLRRNKV